MFKWKMPRLHLHIPWRNSTSGTRHEQRDLKANHAAEELNSKEVLQQAWSKPNEKIHTPENMDGLLPARSIPASTTSNQFAAELKEALDEAVNAVTPVVVRTSKVEVLAPGNDIKGRQQNNSTSSGCKKVFPSVQSNNSGRGPSNGDQFRVTRHLKCVFPWKCKWAWPGCCRYKKRPRKSSRGTPRIRKLLVKFRKKVLCLPCRHNFKDAIPAAGAPMHQVHNMNASSVNKAAAVKDVVTSTIQSSPEPPHEQGCEKQVAFLERVASNSSDPEYWINTDNDYVVLVVSSSKHEEDDKS